MNIFELKPINGRKSFYNKCRVEVDGNISYLYSYNTNVAYYNKEKGEMVVKGQYSGTTTSHVKAFLNFYGFEANPKLYMNG